MLSGSFKRAFLHPALLLLLSSSHSDSDSLDLTDVLWLSRKRHRIGRWFRRTRDGLAARPGLDAPGAPPPVPAAPVALTTIVVPVTASAPVIPTPLAELLAAATPAAGAPFQAMVEWLHQWPAGECTVVDASGRRTKISSEASTATAVTATAAPAPPKSFPTSADDPGRGRARSSPLPLAHLTPGAAAAAVLGSPRQPRRRRGAPGVSRSDDF